jgi:hypothetical protein
MPMMTATQLIKDGKDAFSGGVAVLGSPAKLVFFRHLWLLDDAR